MAFSTIVSGFGLCFMVFDWSIIFTLHQIKSEFMEERFVEVGTSLEMEKAAAGLVVFYYRFIHSM